MSDSVHNFSQIKKYIKVRENIIFTIVKIGHFLGHGEREREFCPCVTQDPNS